MKKLFTCLALGLSAVAAQANTPLWMRDVKLSPDGQNIAFTYKGDIYKVNVNGGKAEQLTIHSAYECNPIWSPDSRQIAFVSTRDGSKDVFLMNADGSNVRKLTHDSGTEIPYTFTPDGKQVVFSAMLQDPASSAMYPTSYLTELYQVPVEGGRIQQLMAIPAEEACLIDNGKTILYQDRKGLEDPWRKHHTSSVTRDLWMYQSKTGQYTNLTNRPGEDRNPVSVDGKTVYFLRERKGESMNVFRFNLDRPEEVKAVTHFKTHPVRFLSMSKEGTLCFTYDGAIYTQKANGTPKKVKIDLVRDDSDNMVSFSISHSSTEATVSPNGEQIAFIVRGEVFVTSTDYSTTKQITHTAGTEEGLTFSADNRTLAYASERDGNWQIYTAKIAREEEPNFANATLIDEEVVLPSKTVERAYPQFSPDGKELAFIEDRRKLMVLNLKSKKVRQITDGSTWQDTEGGFHYQWSPDGKWFTLSFIGNKHDPYSDVGLVSAQGGKITNLTSSGYANYSPMWVMDGNAIMYTTERFGMRNHASWGSMLDLVMVFVNQDAYEKYRLSKEDYELLKELERDQAKMKQNAQKDDKKKDKKKDKKDEKKEAKEEDKGILVELEGIQDRTVRLTPNSSQLGSGIIDKRGENLYYFTSFEGGYDLWKMNLRQRSTRMLHKMDAEWSSLEMDKAGRRLFIFGDGQMQKMDFNSERISPISYRGTLKMDLAKEREAMFNHVCKQVQKRFYNLNMHGCDWAAMTAAYRKFLPHINNNHDFSEMLSELLGELNVSHTGSNFRERGRLSATTARLGVITDWNYEGKGIKVDEVLEGGPLGHKRSKLKAGMIIEKIDGETIEPDTDYTLLLNGKAKKKTLVSIYDPQTKERWDEVVLPFTSYDEKDLLYKRWVKQREEDVRKWSNGRLGYVHIESMDDENFRHVYSDVLGKYNQCDGIVIDIRYNGGGRLHEDIEIFFSGEKYLTQVIRGVEACDMPSRRWNKPSIMVQCEANYSNAHGTPWVYKYKKMGKLVGMPVPGTMTTVNWETLQDPSVFYGLPVIGYRMANGQYLENTQLEPDVKVENKPETILNGEDTQLKVAVEELLKQIDQKK